MDTKGQSIGRQATQQVPQSIKASQTCAWEVDIARGDFLVCIGVS
jgi:hypothetical protein